MKQPNIIFVFGDQWRAQATGYAGETKRAHAQPRPAGRRKPEPGQCGVELPALHALSRQPAHRAVSADARPLRQRRAARSERGQPGEGVCIRRLRHGLHRQVACGRPRPRRADPSGAPPGVPVLEGAGVHPRLQPFGILRRRFRSAALLGRLRRHRPDARGAALHPGTRQPQSVPAACSPGGRRTTHTAPRPNPIAPGTTERLSAAGPTCR